MALKVGDKVSVLDTESTYSIKVGDVGTVVDITGIFVTVQFQGRHLNQCLFHYQLQPIDEVIRVDCRKPSIFKRVCMYLRGKI